MQHTKTQTNTPTYPVHEQKKLEEADQPQALLTPTNNSLDDTTKEVCLLPRELIEHWPSLLPADGL
jgi:hypothetical protein